MHPAMALWIWSLTMQRIWQNAVAGEPEVPSSAKGKILLKNSSAIAITAERYLKSEVIETPLPGEILDRLAELHWMELEPNMAI